MKPVALGLSTPNLNPRPSTNSATPKGNMKFTITTLLMTILFTGCGTICNHIAPAESARPYGGVRMDIEKAHEEGGMAYILLLDVPISLVTDTLLLPLDIPWMGEAD
jgi:uncharacterized protein YceK